MNLDGRPRYYDRQGNPMELMEWADLFEHCDPEYRVVEQTTLREGTVEQGGVHVSTVWLGLDHAFFGGPPLIFETMVFGGPENEEMHRYSTEEEARIGHAGVVEMTSLRLMMEARDR